MRISTAQIFNGGIEAIQRGQKELSRTQLQLSTGRRVLSPSDDPSGAVQTLQFRSGIEKVEQYQRNGQLLEQRLRHSETILNSMGEGLQRVRVLALQGNNSSQTSETRGYMAGEIRDIRDALLDLANSRDANGEYIFAGIKSQTEPFAKDANGNVSYEGADTQRKLQISAVNQVQAGNPGKQVLMDIPNGNGTFVVEANATNAGSGVIDAGTVTDRGLWDNELGSEPYTIRFLDSGDTLQYGVFDSSDNLLDPPGQQEYLSGATISFNGVQTKITGQPQAGDQFTLAESQDQSLFATYSRLADALDELDGAELNNAINRALVDLDQGLQNLLDIRADLGTRMQAVDNQDRINEDQLLQMRSTLSEIEDLDYAEAISRFSLQQTALQAAQQTYVQVQRLSLFNYL
jgi:flagellar hook-associated protein 3 FlgL